MLLQGWAIQWACVLFGLHKSQKIREKKIKFFFNPKKHNALFKEQKYQSNGGYQAKPTQPGNWT